MIRAAALAVLSPVLLAGCAALGALSGVSEPVDAYQIRAPADGPVARGRAQAIDLTVVVPAASAAIDSEGILIRPQATQVQYLPEARWIEEAPLMIQSALVDGLERSGAFRYVGRLPLGNIADFVLVTSLAEFHAEVQPESEAATVKVRLTARLVREDDALVVASRSFEAVAISADTENASVVDAYDRATTEVLGAVLAWVLQTRGVRTG